MTQDEFTQQIEQLTFDDFIRKMHDRNIIEKTMELCLEFPNYAKDYFNRNFKKSNQSSTHIYTSNIKYWLDEYGVENYIINDDMTIDVNGDVDLYSKRLKEFPDYIKFNIVKGDFDCAENQLKTLEGAPKEISGSFDCAENQLKTLEGAPEKVGESFYCDKNQLTTLEGAPKEVGGSFYCDNNQLTTLEGVPETVGGNFYCYKNPGNFTEEDVKKVCKVKRNIYC